MDDLEKTCWRVRQSKNGLEIIRESRGYLQTELSKPWGVARVDKAKALVDMGSYKTVLRESQTQRPAKASNSVKGNRLTSMDPLT